MVIGYQDGGVEFWDVRASTLTNSATPERILLPGKGIGQCRQQRACRSRRSDDPGFGISDPRSPQDKGRVRVPHEISDRPVDASHLSFAPGSNSLLLSGGGDHDLRLWNVAKYAYDPRDRRVMPFRSMTAVPHVAISSKPLIIADERAIAGLLRIGIRRREFAGSYRYDQVHQGEIRDLVISSDNKTLYQPPGMASLPPGI